GGGLLVVGGDRSFSEGGWADTPLSNSLPITLERKLSSNDPYNNFTWLVVRPTRPGQNHPATQITHKEADAAAKWRDLPPVSALNPVKPADAKPGATVLLEGLDQRNRPQIVLAYQRYGKGKTLVLPVQDTWHWRMAQKMPVEDETHHTFWQR